MAVASIKTEITVQDDPTFVIPRPRHMGSIFDNSLVYTTYEAQIHVQDRIAAGTPGDPRIVEAWIMKKLAKLNDDEETRFVLIQTLRELGYLSDGKYTEQDIAAMSNEQLMEAAGKAAETKNTVVFKGGGLIPDPRGIYLETRCVKAMFKEAANVAFADKARDLRMFPNGKGAKNFVAENVFVLGDRLYFGQREPDDTLLFVGHVNGPKGPQSNLTYYQVMEEPVFVFQVLVAKNEILEPLFETIWVTAQQQGLGALRSQGFGRFDVERWEKVAEAREPAWMTKLKAQQAANPTPATKGKGGKKNGKPVDPQVAIEEATEIMATAK